MEGDFSEEQHLPGTHLQPFLWGLPQDEDAVQTQKGKSKTNIWLSVFWKGHQDDKVWKDFSTHDTGTSGYLHADEWSDSPISLHN